MRRRLEEAEVSRGSHPTGIRNANTFTKTRHLRPDLGLRATEERGLSSLRLRSLETKISFLTVVKDLPSWC